jgi:hypothetical protein
MSVRPSHFASEDTTLLVAYAAAIVQERAIAQELAALEAPEEEPADRAKAKNDLRLAHGRVAGSDPPGSGAATWGDGEEPEPP